MKKLVKSFFMIVMLICVFSYMGAVSAAVSKLADV